MPFPRLIVVGALTVVVAAGCGAASHARTAGGSRGKFPFVVAHPDVQSSGVLFPRRRVKRAVLLSPSRLAFMTSGSSTCAWWPKRLTVLGPSSIRIDMRVNGVVSACTGGAVSFPIAVKIDPRVVDVRRPVTVRLSYEVRLPRGGGVERWNDTSVVPALKGS